MAGLTATWMEPVFSVGSSSPHAGTKTTAAATSTLRAASLNQVMTTTPACQDGEDRTAFYALHDRRTPNPTPITASTSARGAAANESRDGGPQMKSSLTIGFSALGANPLRTLLSTLGVIIGVASLVAVLSVGDGLERFTREQLETTPIQTIEVAPRTSLTVDGVRVPGTGFPTFTPKNTESLIRDIAGVAEARLVLAGSARFMARGPGARWHRHGYRAGSCRSRSAHVGPVVHSRGAAGRGAGGPRLTPAGRADGRRLAGAGRTSLGHHRSLAGSSRRQSASDYGSRQQRRGGNGPV